MPFFGLFEWPSLVPKDKMLSQLAGVLHYWGVICSVLALHVLAVAWHSWVKKDEVCPDASAVARRASIVPVLNKCRAT